MKYAILFCAALVLMASRAMAQAPFYNGGAVASDPVISVATDGVQMNVGRAVVSADKKYVTIDMDPQLNSFGGFRNFTFQRGGLGFVGSATAAQSPAPAAGGNIFGGKPTTGDDDAIDCQNAGRGWKDRAGCADDSR